MSSSAPTSYGRIMMVIMLGGLVLTVCLAVCVLSVKASWQARPVEGMTSDAGGDGLGAKDRHTVVMLAVLLISTLLILLYIVGAYLFFRAGQLVARDKVGGKPTSYIDAWASYRLTDEQISAATSEHPYDHGGGGRPDEPERPPSDHEPDQPPSEN